MPSSNLTFVSRNYTDAEVAYCRAQPDPAASFAARWAGKEAVFKSLGVHSKGAAASMKDIEILPNEEGVPTVHLHGEARKAAHHKHIGKVHVSLSHSEVRALLHRFVSLSLMKVNRRSPSHSPKPLLPEYIHLPFALTSLNNSITISIFYIQTYDVTVLHDQMLLPLDNIRVRLY